MCGSCWDEDGAPQIDNEGVRRAADAIRDLYEFHAVGGWLHVVVDDDNIPDDDELVSEYLAEYLDRMGPEERAAVAALDPLTYDERYSAIALYRGYWKP